MSLSLPIGSRSKRLTVRGMATDRLWQPATIVAPRKLIWMSFHDTVRTAAPCRGRTGSKRPVPVVGLYRRSRMKQMQESKSHISSDRVVDEIDRARAQEYALLAILLSRSPDGEMIERVALLRGDASPLGAAHADLAEPPAPPDPERAARRYFDLVPRLGRGPPSP